MSKLWKKRLSCDSKYSRSFKAKSGAELVKHLNSFFALFLVLSPMMFSGCMDTKNVGIPLQEAVEDLRKLRRLADSKSDSLISESVEWRNLLAKSLAADGEIQKGLNTLLKNRVDQLSVECDRLLVRGVHDGLFLIKYANAELLLTVEAALGALNEYAKDPTKSPAEFMKAFRTKLNELSLVATVNRPVPSLIELDQLDPSDVTLGQALRTSKITIFGYGFKEGVHVNVKLDLVDGNTVFATGKARVVSEFEMEVDLTAFSSADLLRANNVRIILNESDNELCTIPVKVWRQPQLPESVLKVKWTHSGELLSVEPERWDFGLLPSGAYVRNSQGETRTLPSRQVVDFSTLKRSDRRVMLAWTHTDVPLDRQLFSIDLDHVEMPRCIDRYEIEFINIVCIHSAEGGGGTDIRLSGAVDGTPVLVANEKLVMPTGSIEPLNKKCTLKKEISLTIFDYDGTGPNDFAENHPTPFVRSVGDLTEKSVSFENGSQSASISFLIDGGTFVLNYRLDPIWK